MKIAKQKDKLINRYLFAVYSLMLLLFFSCVISLLTQPNSYIEDIWQNYAEFNFEQGKETDENGNEITVNYISTPEQLAGAFIEIENIGTIEKPSLSYDSYSNITKISNKVYKLSSNITLSSKKWACQELSNGYTIDGSCFVISGLKISSSNITKPISLNNSTSSSNIYANVGFVSINNGTIKNLYFQDVNISNGQTGGSATNTGVVCGQNNGTIQNITVISGEVSGNTYKDNSDREVGGICGKNAGTIYHCFNYAKVYRGKHFGGIVGMSTGGSIKNCFNYGNICEPYENMYIRVGGIVGESSGTTIELCQNFGKVMGCDYYEYDLCDHDIRDVRAGGIVGHSDNKISKCANYGGISGGYNQFDRYIIYADKSYIGGIVGYYKYSSDIDSCYNQGNIIGYAKSNSGVGVTGIRSTTSKSDKGEQIGFGEKKPYNRVDRVYEWYYKLNVGDVERENSIAYVGGILGYCHYDNVTISNCYSTGIIKGGYDSVTQLYDIEVYLQSKDSKLLGGLKDPVTQLTQYVTITVKQEYMLFHPICGSSNFTENNCYYSNVSYEIMNTVATTYYYKYSNGNNSSRKSGQGFDTTWDEQTDVRKYSAEAYLNSEEWLKKLNYINNIRVSCSDTYFSILKHYASVPENEEDTDDDVVWKWGQAVDGKVMYGGIYGEGYYLLHDGYIRSISTKSYKKSVDLGSAYLQNDNKNDGYHYFKDLYW